MYSMVTVFISFFSDFINFNFKIFKFYWKKYNIFCLWCCLAKIYCHLSREPQCNCFDCLKWCGKIYPKRRLTFQDQPTKKDRVEGVLLSVSVLGHPSCRWTNSLCCMRTIISRLSVDCACGSPNTLDIFSDCPCVWDGWASNHMDRAISSTTSRSLGC